MIDQCYLGPDFGRIAGCTLPMISEPTDWLTMDTSLHAMAVITAVLFGILWTARRLRR